MPRKGENIHKRASDGRWEARCWHYSPKQNLWKYKYIYGSTYEDVKCKKEQFEDRIKNQESEETKGVCPAADAKKIAFSDIAEEWLSEVQKRKKKSTYTKYKAAYRKYVEKNIQGIMLDKITNAFVEQKIFDPLLSESMCRTVYCILKQVLEFAGERYSLLVPKLKKPVCKTGSCPVEVLSREEQAKLIPFLYRDMDFYKMAVALDLHTGLRLGEICALKWSDIDFDNGIIFVERTVQRLPVDGREKKTALVVTEPKTVCSRRKIPVSENVMEMMGRFKHEGEYVFSGKRPMEPRTLENHFIKILKEAGIAHHRYHDLRHTFATNSMAEGVDIKSLSELLGHSNVSTTMNLYVHPTIDTKRKCIEQVGGYYSQFLQ